MAGSGKETRCGARRRGEFAKLCTGERWGDSPRVGQGYGGSKTYVRTPHSGGQKLESFGQGSRSVESFGGGGGRASGPLEPTE